MDMNPVINLPKNQSILLMEIQLDKTVINNVHICVHRYGFLCSQGN